MIKAINFKHVFYFWAVAKQSSIVKASKILNVSQSSISEQLKTLEFNINNSLFDRSQKKMTLTATGKTLFTALDQFFPFIEEVLESIANFKTANVKFLRIGLCPTLSQEIRHRLCIRFIEDNSFAVKVLQGENQYLVEAFNNDELDLIFTTNDTAIPKGRFDKCVVMEKKYCIVSGPNIAKGLPRKDKLQALNGVKFINYTSDSDLHFKAFDFLHENKINPIRIAEIDDVSLIKSTIMEIDCFSILPQYSVKKEITEKKLYQIGPVLKDMKSNLTAIFKTSIRTESFLKHLKLIAKNI